MKTTILTTLLSLLITSGFSQNAGFEYNGRVTRTVKKENLQDARHISDMVPEFWTNLGLPYETRQELDLRKKTDYSQRFSITPHEYDYNSIMEIVSAEISTTINGNAITAKSTGDLLTTEQKQHLMAADLGSDISVNVRIKYKNQANSIQVKANNNMEGVLFAVVVPETEAEYAGGFKQMSAYFTEKVFNKMGDPKTTEKIGQAMVKFTVDETGKVVDVIIARSTNDPELDQLLLEATKNMPAWKPAADSKGKKVKQEFRIPFGGEGC